MAENEKVSVDTEDLKNETKETVNHVKETIKNVDFKNDAEATKGFVKEMFSNPTEAVKRAAAGEDGIFKKAIMIMLVYIIATAAYEILYFIRYNSLSSIFKGLLGIITGTLNPVVGILVLSVIVYLMSKKEGKSLINIISTMVVAAVPMVFYSILDIVRFLVHSATIVTLLTSPICTMLSATSLVLTYYGVKENLEDVEDNEAVSKFAVAKLFAAVIMFVLVKLGLS
jgi:hypothetical protein